MSAPGTPPFCLLQIQFIFHQPPGQEEVCRRNGCSHGKAEQIANVCSKCRRQPAHRGHSIAHTGHVHIHDPVRDIHDHTHIIRAQQLIELGLHDVQADKREDPGHHHMLGELMGDHTGSVNAEDEACQPGQIDEDGPERHQPELRAQFPIQHPPQLHPAVPVHHAEGLRVNHTDADHHRDADDAHQAAAQHPDHAGEELGEDELVLIDRQRVHQVAFPAQQVLIKALDGVHEAEHRDGKDDRDIHDHQNHFEILEACAVSQCVFLPEGHAQHHAQQRQRQIQPEIQAFRGLELIFQQLFQHLNTSRKYASTLLPSVSRISSTAR